MEDFLLDDEFKSDKYVESINHLLFSRSYRSSVGAVEKILKDNGYFGRFKIETVDNRKFGTDILIKIHVYLYESSYTYTWPFNTAFNIDRKLFIHNRRAPRGVINDSDMFFYCVNILATMFKPSNKFSKASSHFDVLCINCIEDIKKNDYSSDNWAYVICKFHSCNGLLPLFKKVIAFLSRIGLISNNKFKIKDGTDAMEICDNLFDIDYWYNI